MRSRCMLSAALSLSRALQGDPRQQFSRRSVSHLRALPTPCHSCMRSHKSMCACDGHCMPTHAALLHLHMCTCEAPQHSIMHCAPCRVLLVRNGSLCGPHQQCPSLGHHSAAIKTEMARCQGLASIKPRVHWVRAALVSAGCM